MVDPSLAYVQEWYLQQCDGDWEHSFGVQIDTLDNPGWRVRIDLERTNLEGRTLSRTSEGEDENDWLVYWSDGMRFEAACGPMGLIRGLDAFRSFSGGE